MTHQEHIDRLIAENRPVSVTVAAKAVGCHRVEIERAIVEGRLHWVPRGRTQKMVMPQDVSAFAVSRRRLSEPARPRPQRRRPSRVRASKKTSCLSQPLSQAYDSYL